VYLQSVAIHEELGNRTGLATTSSQIAILLTERGNSDEELSWNLRNLQIRAELQLPQLSNSLHWLQHQQEALGRRFHRLPRQQLGDEDSQTIMEWLQQLPDPE
jgi:hypothetical protein